MPTHNLEFVGAICIPTSLKTLWFSPLSLLLWMISKEKWRCRTKCSLCSYWNWCSFHPSPLGISFEDMDWSFYFGHYPPHPSYCKTNGWLNERISMKLCGRGHTSPPASDLPRHRIPRGHCGVWVP